MTAERPSLIPPDRAADAQARIGRLTGALRRVMLGKDDPIDVAVIRGTGSTPLGQLGVLPFRGKDLSMIVLLPAAASSAAG